MRTILKQKGGALDSVLAHLFTFSLAYCALFTAAADPSTAPCPQSTAPGTADRPGAVPPWADSYPAQTATCARPSPTSWPADPRLERSWAHPASTNPKAATIP